MKSILKVIGCMFVLILVVFSGCKKEWLDVKSDKMQTVPETVVDFQAILDNFTLILVGLGEVAADGHYYTESDFTSMLPLNAHIQNAYVWTSINQHENITQNTTFYTSIYRRILDMNIILDYVEKSKDKDHAGLGQVKAQALFNRGLLYFELAQVYAPAFKTNSANSDLGLALRLSTDITETSVRSTVKQTYDRIISDLTTSKDALPNTSEYLSRASKSAALGLLAKVYLSMGDYSNAFTYSNEYLKIKSELLDYNTLSVVANFIGVNKEVAFLNLLSASSYLNSRYRIDQSLFDSYDNNDLRKKIFFNVTSSGILFKGHYSNSASHMFIGPATDEMYLIRAECNSRAGKLSDAMKDLNDLLRTRYAKNPDGSSKYVDKIALSETDALTKIFAERKKQLILRNVRWSDLRRLNQDSRFSVTLNRTIGGKQYTLEPNSNAYTFPLPYEIIRLSGMKQNPGW